MNRNKIIQDFESTYMQQDIVDFAIGDTVRVHIRVVEGQKERVQAFMGTVIAKKGSGLSSTFTLYRNAYGSSMERLFLLHSPMIVKTEVVKRGKVRRAKLNYLRGKSGKKAKVQELITRKPKKTPVKEAPADSPSE